ncbi:MULTISPECIES: pro-sigmaK processing inhibitor BofA family protein [Pelosinus]|uniref:Pro-sigmaK processing inhibitor BofA n=1 Tax=Pelosinus fermentans B4 TaxID=1149862 RepID=I9AWR7_9FIRM|nr:MULTISPECIES: pro-sigmaK processing inhibitor BofA family protein [Pelosinus]EIW17312.1 pro-sigmaK processing inhibitor BofA [Pelosinus fermentans B4]EIW23371.1 pro-sigmaK processing inhibitor BofA [Pelosinus fermentans A11]OAM96481.1 pro-sigmaK processing inhibitor BofA [Pelosinus fermentans DSM 17108]SDR40627.1 inhibitor of the pro-sigma K processing machinery [Pelosinus fermentans]
MLGGFGDFNVILAYVFGIILLYVVGRMFLMPIKLIFRLIYNGLIGGAMLWALNFVGLHIGFTIAINPITALIAGFLGLPGVMLLILFKLFVA